jgi:hypothetical protein
MGITNLKQEDKICSESKRSLFFGGGGRIQTIGKILRRSRIKI